MVLFDLARQETTNSAPLSRNICLKFFDNFSSLLCHIISFFSALVSLHGCVFNKSLTGYSAVWGQPLLGTPTRSADRVRLWGSRVQQVRSDDSVLLCVEGWSFRVGGVRGWWQSKSEMKVWRSQGRKWEFGGVSCWADPEPSSCQPEVFALPLTSPLFIFQTCCSCATLSETPGFFLAR